MADRVVARVRNPEGRVVELRAGKWDHIRGNHPALAGYRNEIMRAIEVPDHREPDPIAGRERYFRRGGPEAWLRVVTELSGEVDQVVTAFAQVSPPLPRGRAR